MNKPSPYACRFDDKIWPLACQEVLDLAYELRHGSNKNLVAANVIDAYIELITCTNKERKYVVKKIRKHSEMINPVRIG